MKNRPEIPENRSEGEYSNSAFLPQNSNFQNNKLELPAISLPKGGGAIKGIDEKFKVNGINGTFSTSIALPLSPSRQGYKPPLGLNYNSGSGNSAFGLGWELTLPSISRRTERKLPQYRDGEESDTFILAGTEDLVPLLVKVGENWLRSEKMKTEGGRDYSITAYRPRIEGGLSRIERWTDNENGESHWRTISRDNVCSYYGLTAESRVESPHNPEQSFRWLLSQSHDDKGNLTIYRYKRENSLSVPNRSSERHRKSGFSQLYLKTVLYGNRTPYYKGDPQPEDADFMFKVIFDYGEHDREGLYHMDIAEAKAPWLCRGDSFSSYRAGFEIRTYRRCSRIMMFHCFEAAKLPHSPYLVSSLELFYDESRGLSLLTGARRKGHRWESLTSNYSSKALPDLVLGYQPHEWQSEIKEVSLEEGAQAPAGIKDRKHLWVDLYSEGLTGLLTEQEGCLYYSSNMGEGRLSKAQALLERPSFKGLRSSLLTIQELEGNGVKYLVQYGSRSTGFFKLNPEGRWEPFKNFELSPNFDRSGARVRSLDLDGDGRADLLLSEKGRVRCCLCSGEKGFKTPESFTRALEEEEGPSILFADREQALFLADMSGDGLTDIVRIRSNEINYWPNLGYGRFGNMVDMDSPPIFDSKESFNPAYLRLADVDGSGTADIIYLGRGEFRIWLNRNGNSWRAAPRPLLPFPRLDNLADVSVMDLLGSGTASIVYSSPLLQKGEAPLQYIDLMGSRKPYLLISSKNGCGGELALEYKSSTHYYLEDRRAGRPWITKLPFPVHCLSKMTMKDRVRETIFTSSYSYSHGYYDHFEREFRGFARVESLDSEDFKHFRLNEASNVTEHELHQPPVRRVTWHHCGAYLEQSKLLHQCESEYYKNGSFSEYEMAEPLFPEGLTPDEAREAARALKGLPLRSELYASDGSPLETVPYSASQSGYEIRLLQPRGENRAASFMVIPSESISYSYERRAADPRISQNFTLESDELGNPTKSARLVYPRPGRPTAAEEIPDRVWEEQNRLHIAYEESIYTGDISDDDCYRLRVPYESRGFEVAGVTPQGGLFFNKEGLKSRIASTTVIPYEQEFSGAPERRLSRLSRLYFWNDELTAPLPPGTLSRLALRFKSHNLAFTKELAAKYYEHRLNDRALEEAGYIHLEGDEEWWTDSGIVLYGPDPASRFYLPIGMRDLFGNESRLEWDDCNLLPESSIDALANIVKSRNDYRTLTPVLVTDPNLNRAAVESDELGMVIASAIMGKEGADEGDTLAEPTARMEYNLLNWQNNHRPNYVRSLHREEHGAANRGWQESYAYSDGGGALIMNKLKVAPGKAWSWNEDLKRREEVDADPRWAAEGRTIINNKGNPVKQYEPYFSTTHEYESEEGLVETGVTPIIYYDPLGREIRREFPDGTLSESRFDGWKVEVYDPNDLVKESSWYAERGRPDPVEPDEPAERERRAAWLAAKHAETPTVFYSDSLGRNFYSQTDYGGGKKSSLYTESDPAGRYSKTYDQLGRNVSEAYTNLLGEAIYGKSAERGEQWSFSDAIGRLVKIWDNEIREFRNSYDRLHRPVSSFVKEGDLETLFSHIVYGESLPDAEESNLRGLSCRSYDQSGLVTINRVDFKGNIIEMERRLAKSYRGVIDWSDPEGDGPALLEDEIFSSSSSFDALNRPTEALLPDGSTIRPHYNEGGLLKSLEVRIAGEDEFKTFLEEQDYDAKGQRQFARLGNGLVTRYFYDPKSFRLTDLVTKGGAAPDSESLQNLHYSYDPVGNIVQIEDSAQQTHFFRNAVVRPRTKFEYDALYRLVKASGREHAGAGSGQPSHIDLPFIGELPHANEAGAVRNYRERYDYDDCGNILLMDHKADGGDWTRHYRYNYQDDSSDRSNRLKNSTLPGEDESVLSNRRFHYDLHGNMSGMPHLAEMNWDFMDRLERVDLGGGGEALYSYDKDGNRSRKVIERSDGIRMERIYLGAVEIYREYRGENRRFERTTLHISDDTGRIAQVDTKVLDLENIDRANPLNSSLIRYQYGNHLGSAVLETDSSGTPISYEEYHPYGTSAYRSSKSDVDLSQKRYRFSGKELDSETGLYYFGARYYAPWLGRWTTVDPAGFVSGPNLYRYCSNNPVNFHDPNGMKEVPKQEFSFTEEESVANMKRAETGVEHLYGLPQDRLYPESTPEDRIAFAKRRGYRLVEPHMDQQRWVGTREEGYWKMSSAAYLEKIKSAETPQEGEAPSPSPAAPPQERERSFWERGGSTLVLGLGILGIGILTALTGGGALLMFSAGMAIGAGGATSIGSAALLTASYTGNTTAQEDALYQSTLSDAALFASSPGSVIGGTVGYAIDDIEGLRTGAMIGGLAEGVAHLGVAGARAFSLRSSVQSGKSFAREVTLDEWRLMSSAERNLYNIGQTTVRDPIWWRMVAEGIESNPIAKGKFLQSQYGNWFGRLIHAQSFNPATYLTTLKTGLTPSARYITPPLIFGASRIGISLFGYGVADLNSLRSNSLQLNLSLSF